jgi:hypothetical protein
MKKAAFLLIFLRFESFQGPSFVTGHTFSRKKLALIRSWLLPFLQTGYVPLRMSADIKDGRTCSLSSLVGRPVTKEATK